MEQDFSEICSWYDNQLEEEQIIHLQQPHTDPFIHSENLGPNEVVGFELSNL